MSRETRRPAISLALLAALSVAGIGCSEKEAPAPAAVVDVQAATVADKTIQEVVTADAVVYPLHEATIVPKINAPVEKYYKDRGSAVKAGELLATLENKDLAAAVEQAKGAYQQAQAAYATATKVDVPAQVQDAELNLEQARQAMEAAQQAYDSRLKLYQAGAMARNLLNDSHVAFIQARNQYEIALAHRDALQKVSKSEMLKSAEGQLTAAKGNYEAAAAQLEYSEIRSPIDGVITDRPLFEGQMASTSAPLFTVMDTSRLVGRAYVPPQQAAALKAGDAASIVAANGEATLPGKVTVVSPALDPESTTVQVWVEAANPGGRVKPGATARLRMVARTVNHALVVPAAAVLTDSDGATTVMVIGSDHHAHQTAVKVGVRNGDEVQILSGVQRGQQVVTAGAYSLPDGTEVRVQGASADGRPSGPAAATGR